MPPIDRTEPGSLNGYHLPDGVPAFLAVEPPVRPRQLLFHIALFFATLGTATFFYAVLDGADPITNPASLVRGLPFSLPLMLILLSHEMGHYLLARKHHVRATLPYFIPGFPTFGAFIRMQSLPSDRRVLFDIGAAGPWAGVAATIPALILGLSLSEVHPLSPLDGGLYLGDSLLFTALTHLVLGVSGTEVSIALHPIAFAGWFGLFVTFLNLLPVGQLDGGHVVYSLFGSWHRWVARAFLAVIAVLGAHGWTGWFFWIGLLALLGIDHPPTRDFHSSLDRRRKVYAWCTVGLFFLTFMPIPISQIDPITIPNAETIPIAYVPDHPVSPRQHSFPLVYRP
jgi:membrane-associated protease RseP (regulator of RpoE activity)